MTQRDKSTQDPIPMSPKRLKALVGYGTGVLTACIIMMWSVFNAWLNVLTFTSETNDNSTWGMAAILVVVLCVIPFSFGLALLIKTLGPSKR